MAECGTHAVFAAEIGTYSQSEATLNGPLLDRLEPGMLLPADRTPAAERAQEPMLVRVIGYTVDDGRENPTSYRLFTTLLDPDEVTATDLAAAYTQRWEIELTFDESKTHQRGPRTVLRSKSPDLVLQEIWGHLCCYYAIRCLMAQAATHSGHDPDRVSFVAALRITRQTLAHPGAFSP